MIVRGRIRPLRFTFRSFCRLVVRVFYRRYEVFGLEHIPASGPVLLCGNHPSALADGLILQAALRRPLHPLARAGLFRNPLLRPFLAMMNAVPIHRRQDERGDTARNVGAFSRCYDLLAAGGVLLIFPEGESHADSRLRTFKTGAARIALGALEQNGRVPVILPVGLNFSEVGRFRGSVLVNVGAPVPVTSRSGETPEQGVLRLTASIQAALEGVTLNHEDWRDLDMLRRVERFFALRRNRVRTRSMSQRFRTLKKLSETHLSLWREHPEHVERIRHLLHQFERLCGAVGVQDYHLTLDYTPGLVARFVARSLTGILVLLPLGLWGALNAALPFWLTGTLSRRISKGPYQLDTARISMGLGFFTLFWGLQTALVVRYFGPMAALLYAVSLPPTGAMALFVSRERERIVENARVFLIFMRKRELRDLLRERRRRLERELAKLVLVAKRRKDPA